MPEQKKLEDAQDEIKLAVDLIYLLETNNIQPQIALKALKIVENDLLKHCQIKANEKEKPNSEA